MVTWLVDYPGGRMAASLATNLRGAALGGPAAQLRREDLLRAYRIMSVSRRIDDREIVLKRQNKIFFQISGAGHEAIQTAAGMNLRPGHDWFFLYYRDRALALTLGATAEDMLLASVGAGADPSSATGTQFLPAVGCAHAERLLDRDSDALTLVSSGEGATSEGEFWESLNASCLERLPILYLVQDNGYAISVPVEKQTAGGNLARLVENFPGLAVFECDGTDFPASYNAMAEAVAYCRSRRGPALVHATCTRPYSHSLSDDEKFYKTQAERKAEAARDPILKLQEWLIGEGAIDAHGLEMLHHEADVEVQAATQRALKASPPEPGSALTFLYSNRIDPTSEEFEAWPVFSGEPRTMVDSINRTLHEEMRRNEMIVVFGEDVADCSREENLREVKGKGGVFKATQGLQRAYGSERVFNTPIAEASIIGRAAGMATRGIKPIVEIQFFDYIWPAMMQIRDELASLRWRSHNGFSAPMVIRVAIGGYLSGGAIYHSQCGESIFTHLPGLRVVLPSNALDACGLLRMAIRCDDPVMFLEHKKLYREAYNRSPHPGPDFTIPFGKAKVVKQGSALTMVTFGALVQKSLRAALEMEQKYPDRTVEVIDLRSLAPYDWETIRASVEKTSRVMVVHENCLSWGYGAEIAARIASELFSSLDAPVGRVAALDTWVAYHPRLEEEILPRVETIAAEADRLLSY